MTPTKTQPDEQVLQGQVQAIVGPFMADAKTGIVTYPEITSPEAYVDSTAIARDVKAKMAEVEAAYDEHISQANALHKGLIAKKKTYWQPYKNLFDAIERRLSQYRFREEEKRKAEEKRLQEQAQENEKKRLLEEAAQLETSGNPEEAAMVLDEALNAPAPVVVAQSVLPKVEGVHSRKTQWRFEVVDSTKLKDDYWTPDLEAIKAVVQAKGELAENMIGRGSIRVWRDTSTVIRKV